MKEMQKMQGMNIFGNMPDTFNVVINTNHPLSLKLTKMTEGEAKTQLSKLAFDLARLSQNLLHGEELTAFIQRNTKELSA
jgi:molecular chaperone HtpG